MIQLCVIPGAIYFPLGGGVPGPENWVLESNKALSAAPLIDVRMAGAVMRCMVGRSEDCYVWLLQVSSAPL